MAPQRRRLPDFLLIGAQKSGTTTLYEDLNVQPSICMSSIKEPEVLVKITDPPAAADYYARLFEVGAEHQRLGEASTVYSQLPRHQGVAERARDLLGADLRLIYLVRNPVERALSHHYHDYTRGHAGPNVDRAVRENAAFIDHGRYAMQLEPWIRAFGKDALLVLPFETYVAEREATVRRVGEFLSVPVDTTLIATDRAYNKSEGNRIYGYLRPLLSRDIWRLRIRPLVPKSLRLRVRDVLAPKAPDPPAPPQPDTVEYLLERLAPDAERLRELLGPDAPGWDFEATRKKYAARVA